MRKMKDSRIEWIGEIPEDWEIVRLKYYVEYNPPVDTSIFSDEDDVSFIPMENLKNGYHTISTVQFEKVKKGYVQFSDNDILIAKVTPCFENGNLAIASNLSNGIGFGSTEINVIRCRSIETKYLYYYFQNKKFIERASYDMYGVAGLKRLISSFIPNSYYPMPPISEQKNISDYLDCKCTEIDLVIKAKEDTNEKLKEYRQSVIYEAVTKGLDRNVTMKDSGIEWIGEIPERWETSKVKYFSKINSGTFLPNNDYAMDGIYAVIGGNGINGYCNKSNINVPCIVIGRVGALCGNIHLVNTPCWITDNALIMTLDDSKSIKYMYYYLIAYDLNRESNKSAQPLITGTQVQNIIVTINALAEQQQIADYLDKKCAEIDSLISANEVTIEKLKKYRQSVIYETVTGKIEI